MNCYELLGPTRLANTHPTSFLIKPQHAKASSFHLHRPSIPTYNWQLVGSHNPTLTRQYQARGVNCALLCIDCVVFPNLRGRGLGEKQLSGSHKHEEFRCIDGDYRTSLGFPKTIGAPINMQMLGCFGDPMATMVPWRIRSEPNIYTLWIASIMLRCQQLMVWSISPLLPWNAIVFFRDEPWALVGACQCLKPSPWDRTTALRKQLKAKVLGSKACICLREWPSDGERHEVDGFEALICWHFENVAFGFLQHSSTRNCFTPQMNQLSNGHMTPASAFGTTPKNSFKENGQIRSAADKQLMVPWQW